MTMHAGNGRHGAGPVSERPTEPVGAPVGAGAPGAAPDRAGPPDPRSLLLSTAGLRPLLIGLFWDVGASLIGYYGLRLLGASEWVALLGATVAAALRIVWVAVRDRRFNAFAAVMLIVFGLGFLFAIVGGDVRFLLLKDSVTTGAIGLTFLVTAAMGRPLTLLAIESWQPDKAADVDELYRTNAVAHRGFLVSAVVWGVGLLGEALVRVPLVYLLPVDVTVGLSSALMAVVIVSLAAWNGWYVARTVRHLTSSSAPA